MQRDSSIQTLEWHSPGRLTSSQPSSSASVTHGLGPFSSVDASSTSPKNRLLRRWNMAGLKGSVVRSGGIWWSSEEVAFYIKNSTSLSSHNWQGQEMHACCLGFLHFTLFLDLVGGFPVEPKCLLSANVRFDLILVQRPVWIRDETQYH